VAKLEIGEPLGDDVEKGRVHPNGHAYDGDDDPALRGLVRLLYPKPPIQPPRIDAPGMSFPSRFSS